MAPGNLSQISLRMPEKSGMDASSSAERTSPPRSAARMTSLAMSGVGEAELVDDGARELAGGRDAGAVLVLHDDELAGRDLRRLPVRHQLRHQRNAIPAI